LDLDLCYSRDTSNLQKLVDFLPPARPRLRGAPAGFPFGWDLTTLKNGFNFTLTTDFGDIALLAEITGVGDYEQVKGAALPVSLFGFQFLVISLDGLITAKRAAGRKICSLCRRSKLYKRLPKAPSRSLRRPDPAPAAASTCRA
jgi:hypothetical protein